MNYLILQTATRFMLPVLLLFSVFLLFRGHNDPGGGFTGGLVGACAFALYALAFNVAEARRAMRVEPSSLVGVGLLVALATGCVSLARGMPLLVSRGFWTDLEMPGIGHLHVGLPILFDVGVYLVVIGVTLTIVWTLGED